MEVTYHLLISIMLIKKFLDGSQINKGGQPAEAGAAEQNGQKQSEPEPMAIGGA